MCDDNKVDAVARVKAALELADEQGEEDEEEERFQEAHEDSHAAQQDGQRAAAELVLLARLRGRAGGGEGEWGGPLSLQHVRSAFFSFSFSSPPTPAPVMLFFFCV